MRYFRVGCKQGHHGRGKYQPIVFVFEANNAIEAMDMAKEMPGVKHSKMILYCKEISRNEYKKYRRISAYKRVEERPWLNI